VCERDGCAGRDRLREWGCRPTPRPREVSLGLPPFSGLRNSGQKRGGAGRLRLPAGRGREPAREAKLGIGGWCSGSCLPREARPASRSAGGSPARPPLFFDVTLELLGGCPLRLPVAAASGRTRQVPLGRLKLKRARVREAPPPGGGRARARSLLSGLNAIGVRSDGRPRDRRRPDCCFGRDRAAAAGGSGNRQRAVSRVRTRWLCAAGSLARAGLPPHAPPEGGVPRSPSFFRLAQLRSKKGRVREAPPSGGARARARSRSEARHWRLV
jgi:hypothetical protein